MILARGDSDRVAYGNLDAALGEPDTQIRLFGKPEVRGERRMGVALARRDSIAAAREAAKAVAAAVDVQRVTQPASNGSRPGGTYPLSCDVSTLGRFELQVERRGRTFGYISHAVHHGGEVLK